MTLARILLSLAPALACLPLSRRCLHYSQLESYQLPGVLRSFRRQYKRVCLPGLCLCAACAAIFYLYDRAALAGTNENVASLLAFLLCVLSGFLLSLPQKKEKAKKPFVVTARVKRFYGVLTLVFLSAACLCLLSPLAILPALIPVFLPALVFIADALALPLEKFIARLYFNDARRRLRERPDLIRVGITGSYGKTSVKFMLDAVLSQKYNVLVTPASFNTPMGLTRVIRERLTPAHQVFLAEMGARHRGDIRELCRLVRPTIGVLVSVGPQHLETFHTQERVTETKYDLIRALPGDGLSAFLDDGAIVTSLYNKTQGRKILAGRENADCWAEDVRVTPEGSAFTLRFKDGTRLDAQTRLLGALNIRNLTLVCALAKAMGLSDQQLLRGVAAIKPVEHRLQLLTRGGGVNVIDDAFNSNPRGAKAAFDALSAFPGRRIVVTPGMVELGAKEEEMNEQLGRDMAGKCDLVYLIGEKRAQPILKGLLEGGFPRENARVVKSLSEATAELHPLLRAGDTVLYENDLPDHYTE